MSDALFQHVTLPIVEASQPGEARRTAVHLAEQLGFDETQRGRLAIVVTELARNLVQHAQGGEALLRGLEQGDAPGLEVLALDKGRGMADVAHSLSDGVSTCGTLGTGLGAVRRLSDVFDAYSRTGSGTAVLAQLFPHRRAQRNGLPSVAVGAVAVPHHGETVCGDAWDVRRSRMHGDLSGLEVLEQLKSDPATTQVPVVVCTSKRLTATERRRLSPWAAAILSKAGPPETVTKALKSAGVVLTAEHEAFHA